MTKTRCSVAVLVSLLAVFLMTIPGSTAAIIVDPGGETGDPTCPEPATIALIAGQNIDVGTVDVAVDGAALTVAYHTTGGWWMSELHLAIATDASGLPQTRSGNPKVGRFEFSSEFEQDVDEYTFRIPMDQLAETLGLDLAQCDATQLTIAAHASVHLVDADGSSIQQETAWAEGSSFPGKSWAMYFETPLNCCDPDTGIAAGDFRTQTQAGWSVESASSNPGSYRDQWFDTCFVNGLLLGDGPDTSLLLTAAWAVAEFLPQTATPGPFSGHHEDPGTTEAGSLAGEMVALALNINFDQCDPDFGLSNLYLADLIVNDDTSPCHEMTVQQVFDEGNAVLAGYASTFTADQVSSCAAQINENFIPGTNGWAYLRLP